MASKKGRLGRIVKLVMKTYPNTRNNDHDLIIGVYYALGFEMTPEQREKFRNLPTPETVTRLRRKIQEKGEYLPAEAVGKFRRHKSLVVQQNAPTASVERLEDVLNDSES